MPFTVRVRNFQSIEDATIVVDGFVVITGPNNSGKTALMRAIRGVFTNAPAGPLVRHGATHLTVDLDFGDGNTVRWEKGDKVNRYTLNGKALDNVGRGCPPEVLALGIQPIRAGTDSVWPQVADQFKGVLFLVGAPGSAVAEAVADVERVGDLTSALKLAETDRRSANTTLNVRRADAEELTKELASFEGLDSAEALVTQVETRTNEVRKLEAGTNLLRDLKARHNTHTDRVDALAGVAAVVLPDASRLAALKQDQVAFAGVRVLKSRRDTHYQVVTSLAGSVEVAVPAPALVSEIRTLREDLHAHVRLRSGLLRHRSEEEAFRGVGRVVVPEPGSIRDSAAELLTYRALASRLSISQKREQSARQAAEALTTQTLPDPERTGKMRQALRVLREIQVRRQGGVAAVQSAESELQRVGAELEQVVAEVSTLLGDRGECPTCGRVVDAEHVHGGAL